MTCLHMCTPACIYGCLPACMHAYRHICMPVRMNACPPGWHKSRPAYRNCLHLCMPACIYACLPAHMHACLHNAFLPGSKKASLLIGTTCIYTCMPACMHACLHICMHACIYACLPGWHKSRHVSWCLYELPLYMIGWEVNKRRRRHICKSMYVYRMHIIYAVIYIYIYICLCIARRLPFFP